MWMKGKGITFFKECCETEAGYFVQVNSYVIRLYSYMAGDK